VLILVSVIVILVMPNHRIIELPKSIFQLRLTEEIYDKQAEKLSIQEVVRIVKNAKKK
jgi:hypothetical protein